MTAPVQFLAAAGERVVVFAASDRRLIAVLRPSVSVLTAF